MSNFIYGDKYSPFLHDAVLLYAIALNQTMMNGGDVRSGVVVAEQMRGKAFRGIVSASTQSRKHWMKRTLTEVHT